MIETDGKQTLSLWGGEGSKAAALWGLPFHKNFLIGSNKVSVIFLSSIIVSYSFCVILLINSGPEETCRFVISFL